MDKELKLNFKEVRVPSASVKALVATDYEIVAAPGLGKVIVLVAAVLTLDYATATYAWANTDHNITVGGATFANDAGAQALIEASARYSVRIAPTAAQTVLTENQALSLGASGTGEPTTGDSDLVVRVLYAVVDVITNDQA